MSKTTSYCCLTLLLTGWSHILPAAQTLHLTQTAKGRYELVQKEFRLRISPRTRQQIAAFYEGRGFPKVATKELQNVCFFGIGLHNKSQDILWLDLSNWQFSSHGKPVTRLDKQYWRARWQQLGIAKPLQSTFRWTQMPEALNYLPDEREGGNIILPRDKAPFSVTATLIGKQDRSGKRYHIQLDNLDCAK
jgi:hypothetical protein